MIINKLIFLFALLFLITACSKKIENESLVAKTINSIAYGMTTAIVCKIVFFPENALNFIPNIDRIIPFFIGIVVFLFFSKNTNLGLIAGIGSFSVFIIFRNYLI